MGVVLQHQPGRALRHLGRIGQRLVPGQAAGHAAIRKGFYKHGAERRAAAGDSAGRVEPLWVDPVDHPRSGQQVLEVGQLLLSGVHPVVLHHTGPHCHRSVGHQADHRIRAAGHLLNAPGVQPRGHGGQHEPVLPRLQNGDQPGEHLFHHLGLHPQKDQAALPGHRLVVRRLRAQLTGHCLRFGPGPVGQKDRRALGPLDRRPGHRRTHGACADKANG